MKHVKLFVIVNCLGLLLFACTGALPLSTPTTLPPSPTSPPPTATSIPPTDTPARPTNTPEPTSTPEPVLITSLEEILGDWHRIQPDLSSGKEEVIRVNPDGTILAALDKDLKIALSTLERGRHNYIDHAWFEGDYLFFKEDPTCSPGEGKYKVYQLANGNIRLRLVSDDCVYRTNHFATEWELIQKSATPEPVSAEP
jgi:hypothetical protein